MTTEKIIADCCEPPKINNVNVGQSLGPDKPRDKQTVTLRLPISAKTAGVVALILIAAFSLVQTAQLFQLRSAFKAGVPAAAASSGSTTNNLNALPDMVGGC